MKPLSFRSLALLVFGCLATLSPGVAPICAEFPPWAGRERQIERHLVEGVVVEQREIGMGVTKPIWMSLEYEGQTMAAVWKPLRPGYYSGYWESYQNEVAAYRMDQFLGLGMVPPTVHRVIAHQAGSLQFWVEGARLYSEVEGQTPTSPSWSHQLSRMKLFDNLLYNRDRNAGNFMVDDEWNIILIDHSRAMLHNRRLDNRKDKLPQAFDRSVLARLEQLDERSLAEAMGDLQIGRSQSKGILRRRDLLLELAAERIAERGEAAVLFD